MVKMERMVKAVREVPMHVHSPARIASITPLTSFALLTSLS